jgi:serine/threonine protein kinase
VLPTVPFSPTLPAAAILSKGPPVPKVFISHSTKDREIVEQEVISLLAGHHIETWYARDDIQTASEWEASIREGLEACDWFLVVMSPRSAASKWVQREVGWAMDNREGRIIPVLLEECNRYLFHLGMPRIQHVDLRGDAAEVGRRLLKLLLPEINNPLDLQGEQERQGADLRDLYQHVLNLKRALGLIGSSVGPTAAPSARGEAERRQAAELLERWNHLPSDRQRRCPALLNSLAQVLFAVGRADAAIAAFRAVAEAAAQPRARAEAQHNAHQAALLLRDWEGALATLREAAAGDPERWAPFPLGKYEPRQILGTGGFGVLFLCRHRHLGTSVVVKALIRECGEPAAEVFSEAALLEELDHPALVRVRDGDFALVQQGREKGEERQRPFLVLDYFEAPDLHRHVEEKGPLKPGDLLAVACPVAEALHEAHRRGILHRDVKPANVLLRREGESWRVKLIDFGLARRHRGDVPAARDVAGTLDYAPPEQLGRRAEAVGPYSDVYGFARTCCYGLFKTPQPLRGHWQQLPEPLADLLDRCLAEAPADRPQHFGEVIPRLQQLRERLAGAAALTPQPPPPTSPPTVRPEPSSAAAADLKALLAVNADDLQRLMSQMLDKLQSTSRRALQPAASLSLRSEGERALVRQLVARYRSLPEGERRNMPDLLDAVGKLQLASGEFEAAQDAFREVVSMASVSPETRSEAHFNAYRAALERADWNLALRELREACRLDAGRFSPFPPDVLETERVLGGGAFGAVFLCRHRVTGQPVIVKSLADVASPGDVERLFAVSRAVARVTHPALLRILEFGYADPGRKERPYVVMEYFDGTRLNEFVLRQGSLGVSDLLAVAGPAALALQACHAAGVVHGFVTPETLLVARRPQRWEVKVVDVGSRPPLQPMLQTPGGSVLDRTRVGSAAGALDYAAPEQLGRVAGVAAGPPSDVYGWARTCCFALFGTPNPRARDWRGLPRPLADLLEECLAEHPGERLGDFGEVARRLAACSP